VRKLILSVLLISVWSLFLKADDGLKHSLEAGFISTSGNTKSSTVNAEYKMEYKTQNKTDIKFNTDLLYGKKSGKTTNERYRANLNIKHYYQKNLFSYAEISYLKNRFEGYKHQINGGFGFGYRIIESSKELLLGLGGLLMRYNNYSDDKKSETLSFIKASTEYKYKFSEKNSFSADWYIMTNSDDIKDYETSLKAKLVFKLNKKLAFTTGVEIKYDNTPPAKNLYKTDSTTNIGLSYSF